FLPAPRGVGRGLSLSYARPLRYAAGLRLTACASISRPAARAAGDLPGESRMSSAASPRVTPPAQGAKITISSGKLIVPQNPIGRGSRSLTVALRQMLDLFVCLRPVRWYRGVPSPVRHPEKVDMVIFRENTEDIYTGIEFEAGSPDNHRFLELFRQAFPKAYA